MGFNEFFLILRARWRMACVIFCAVVVLVSALPLGLHNKYTASSFIVVDAKTDPVQGGNGPSDAVLASYINTQADIITSERVAQKVAKSTGMDQMPAYQETWRKKTQGVGDIDAWLGRYLLTGKKVVAAPPANANTTRQTNVIEIAVTWTDPKLAAKIANGFAQAAIETNIELKVQPAKQYAAYFDQRSAALRADLERKQKLLSDFQNAKGIVATDDKLDNETTRLNELSTALVAVQAQRQEAQSRQKQGSGAGNEFLPEVLQSPLIASIKDALTAAEAKRTEAAGRLGKNHPDYQAAEAEVMNLRARLAAETNKIVASLGSSAQINLRRESELRDALEAQKKKVLELKNAHDAAANLSNDVVTAQRDLDAVTTRLAQSKLESLAQQTNVVLLALAAEPLERSSPKESMFMAAGVFLGLVLGIGAVLLMEMWDKRLRAEEDLVRLLGVPVLGRIKTLKPGSDLHPTAV
jgi:chain length determinant protein EpsF